VSLPNVIPLEPNHVAIPKTSVLNGALHVTLHWRLTIPVRSVRLVAKFALVATIVWRWLIFGGTVHQHLRNEYATENVSRHHHVVGFKSTDFHSIPPKLDAAIGQEDLGVLQHHPALVAHPLFTHRQAGGAGGVSENA
jgi:hypothetical protein